MHAAFNSYLASQGGIAKCIFCFKTRLAFLTNVEISSGLAAGFSLRMGLDAYSNSKNVNNCQIPRLTFLTNVETSLDLAAEND